MATRRKDSAHEKAQIMAEALKGTDVPKYLNVKKEHMPFWIAVIDARAVWTDSDLPQAANLARCQYDIERIQMEIYDEGDTIANERGTVVMNPKHSLLETLSRRAVALSRVLQVHAAATQGEAKLSRGKNDEKRKAVETRKNIKKDNLSDLLPGSQATH